MTLEETAKQNSTIIIWVTHGLIALYIYGRGRILSYDASDIVVYAALGLSLFVYNLMHKDLLQALSKQVPEPPTPPPPPSSSPPAPPAPGRGQPLDQNRPFDLNIGGGTFGK